MRQDPIEPDATKTFNIFASDDELDVPDPEGPNDTSGEPVGEASSAPIGEA